VPRRTYPYRRSCSPRGGAIKPPEAQAGRALALRAALVSDPPRRRRFRKHPPGALRLLGDGPLAQLASEGDRAAFAVIFDRYHQPLYRYCLSILRDSHDAADAVQSTMLNALRSLEGDGREIALRPWLYRIAFNESIALLRRRPTSTLDDLPMPARLDVEEDLELRERFDELLADMQELPERQRGALAMRELAGLGYDDIAAALTTSPAAVKQAIYEARRALHELARGRAMDCEVIREALADGDGRALRGRAIRAHLRACRDCRELRETTKRRRSGLASFAPAMPAFAARRLAKGLGLAGGGGALAEGGLVTAGLPAGLKALTAVVAGVIASTGIGAAGSGGVDAGAGMPQHAPTALAAVPVKHTDHSRGGSGRSHGAAARGGRRAAGRHTGASHGQSGDGRPRQVTHLQTQPTTTAGAAATDHGTAAPQAPRAADPSPQRPHPVRAVLPPRGSSDPGPIATTVQTVHASTPDVVGQVRQTLPEVRGHLPAALPKRRVTHR
jgi:RNA polymerase sigma factor (sigma-70 family)